MPLTVSTSCGYSPSSAIACFSACSTPKSPQPGHQSGSLCPLKSLTVSGARSSIETSIVIPLHQDLVRGHVLTGGASKDRFHAVDDVMRHERLSVVLADVTFGLKARF